MKNPALGVELVTFLKSFEGATAGFTHAGLAWSLWLPEMNAGERPLTPATQLFFPVFLRGHDQAFAIRFFYDCSSGKIRYYTGAIPEEVSDLPEFQNAISEIFRHSLPVEPIRQRKLHKSARQTSLTRGRRSRGATPVSLADPVESLSPVPAPPAAPLENAAALVPVAPPEPAAPVAAAAAPPPPQRIRLELGDRARHVLMAAIITFGILALASLAAYVFLEKTEDPGVRHHQMQLEALKFRSR